MRKVHIASHSATFHFHICDHDKYYLVVPLQEGYRHQWQEREAPGQPHWGDQDVFGTLPTRRRRLALQAGTPENASRYLHLSKRSFYTQLWIHRLLMKCSCRFIRLVHHKDTWFSFAQNHPSMRRGLCLLWISDSIPYQPELQWPCDTVVEDIWASLLRTCSQSPNPISRYEQPLLWMIINGHRREKCYCWFEERWYETKTGEKEEVPSHLWERKKWYQASLPPAGRTFRHYKALSRCVIMLESPDGKGEGQDKCSNCLCNLNRTSFVTCQLWNMNV